MRNLKPFRELLARRKIQKEAPMTICDLAELIKTSPSHLTQVLQGRRSAIPTWKKLEKILTAEEMEKLGRGAPAELDYQI